MSNSRGGNHTYHFILTAIATTLAGIVVSAGIAAAAWLAPDIKVSPMKAASPQSGAGCVSPMPSPDAYGRRGACGSSIH